MAIPAPSAAEVGVAPARRWSPLPVFFGRRRAPVLVIAIAVALAAFMAVPLFYVFYRGLTGSSEVWDRLIDDRLPDLFVSTLKLAICVSLVTVVVGVGLAWLIVRTDLPGRGVFVWLAAMPLSVPPYVGALVYIAILGPNGYVEEWLSALTGTRERDLPMPEYYSLGGTTLALSLFTYPYVYLMASAALRSFNPTLEEASAASGRRMLSTFWSVVLPLLRPAIGAGVLLVALYVLSDFGTVSLMRYDTFSRAIYDQFTSRFDRSAASILSTVLVLITIVVLWGQSFSEGRARYYQTIGGWRPPRPVKLGRWRYPALAAVVTVLSLALFIPIGLLVYWTVEGLTDSSVASDVWSYSDDSIYTYAWNSLWTAAAAATLAVLVALPLAFLAVRFDSPFSRWLARLSQAGYALPGVVVGLSLIFLLNNYVEWLYGSAFVVVLAYLLRFYPQAHQSTTAALTQVSPNMEEAARSLGRRPERAFLEVTVPFIRPGLMAGWALVFLTSLKELPATLLLRPAGFDTLPVRIWINSSEGIFTLAAPLALLLVLCSAVPLYFLLRQSRVGPTVIT
ncbi:MAG: iron ABC transporter permease [Dehalococcoidia bacterium]